jgi:hypothetical protein
MAVLLENGHWPFAAALGDPAGLSAGYRSVSAFLRRASHGALHAARVSRRPALGHALIGDTRDRGHCRGRAEVAW